MEWVRKAPPPLLARKKFLISLAVRRESTYSCDLLLGEEDLVHRVRIVTARTSHMLIGLKTVVGRGSFTESGLSVATFPGGRSGPGAPIGIK